MNNTPDAKNINPQKDKAKNILDRDTCFEEMDSDEFIDEEKIDTILNEIENEMGKNKPNMVKAEPFNNNHTYAKYPNVPNPFSTKLTVDGLQNPTIKPSSNKKLNVSRKFKPKAAKSNYTFIELLERKLSLSDDEEKAEAPKTNNGFSDTIKSQIQKYLTKAQTKTDISDKNIEILLDKPEDGLASDDEKTQEVKTINLDSEILNSPTESNYPRYEIKEILGGQNFKQQNIKKNSLLVSKVEENLIYNPDSKDYNILTSINNIKVDGTRTYDTEMEDSVVSHNMETVIIDDEDDRKNRDNDIKEEDLNDTLILNLDETNTTYINQENVKKEVDHCNKNDSDDIICVEEYNFKRDNNECHNNVATLDLDVIMISPSEVNVEYTNRNNRDMNDQCSDVNTNNFAKDSDIPERSNNNPKYVVLDNNKFQDLYMSNKTDSAAKKSCSDIVLRDRYQHAEHNSPTQNQSLAIQGIRYDLGSTEMDRKGNIACNAHKFAKAEDTIVNNKPEVENYISQSTKVNRCFEAKNRREDANSSQYAQITENKPIEDVTEYESYIDLDLEPIHLPNNIDLEPSKDYKIDQSMFDPKTLLQSVAEDESDEIVPPPPEFCDDMIYLSNYDNEKPSMADYNVTGRAPEPDMFKDINMEYNESIFGDCSAKNLSPSTEIETWNLSQDDSWEPCNVMNLNPTQSFTIMRKNTQNDFDFMQNSMMTRQENLAKFRFNQKSKLKIRK
ncbi:hypothetical protein PYW07_004669 [Mythimna separata]|uniref:Uncharacterized protein n=1 Tax=Mythimna separata TaxID=271217 RepID=A0AAD7YZ29_MYTSE|nr:hypothetical protein PYW07_004669 [Mythimna separata]